MKKLYRQFLLAALVVISTLPMSQARNQEQDGSVLLRRDRPSVYIQFERSWKAPPLFEGEREERIWLRLNNNARWAIAFCSLAVERRYGEIGVVHSVKRYRPFAGGSAGSQKRTLGSRSSAKTRTLKGFSNQPEGYSAGDTCTPYDLESGKSVVFSVPRSHLDKGLYVEFEFWPEWENRDNELGDFPQYYVSFGYSQLPNHKKASAGQTYNKALQLTAR
jgi:hypothetical protein